MGEAEFRGLAQIARRLEFFRSLTGAQLDNILSRIQVYGFDRGETVFKKGDLPTAFFIIYDGRVRIHLGYRMFGLFKKMAHLGPGDLFGEMALIEGRPRSGTATA
jgi:CRP/FNR family cyclic AMP-dependent transcriptional regulator